MPATAFMARMDSRIEAAGTSSSRRRAQRAQLPEVLKRIELLLRDEPGSFPGLQLAGADLEDAQNVLTAITGHAWMLPQVNLSISVARSASKIADAELRFPAKTLTASLTRTKVLGTVTEESFPLRLCQDCARINALEPMQ